MKGVQYAEKSRKLLSVVLSFLMMTTAMMPAWATTGTDYDNHWAKPAIIKALESGILKGYPDGTIKPDNLMTRAEFFSMVNNAFGYTEIANVKFNDVNESAWYAPVVKKAFAAGYLDTLDGYVRPSDFITREEVAMVLSLVKSLGEAKSGSSLLDLDKASTSGKSAIMSVLEAKIMKGTPDNTFMPTAKTKRSEALTALINAMGYVSNNTVYNKAGTYGIANETTTINGNVIIKTGGVTLKNIIVTGDLTIAKEVGDGNVTLDTVTVTGSTFVNGGGVNSIYFINVVTGSVYVQKTDGPVRIVATGDSAIKNLLASTDVKLVETAITGTGFGSIIVQQNATSGVDISLVGVNADSIQIEASWVTLNSDATSTINNLVVDAANTKIEGQGVISNAEVNVSGTTFEKPPTKTTVAEGVSAPAIGGGTTNPGTNTPGITTPTTPGTTTGGSGGSVTREKDSPSKSMVTQLTNADVAITSGSVVFGYTFIAPSGTITYAQAKGAPYYLNESTSSITLTDGSHTASAYLSALGISDSGTVSYADINAIQTAFSGLNFVPTEVDIHLIGATYENQGANQWALDVTVTLEAEEIALMNPGFATAPASVSLAGGSTAAATVSAVSSITINGAPYTSGADYTISGPVTHTIVVTTLEADKTPSVRTFTFTVAADGITVYATTPDAISLTAAVTSPAAIDFNVSIPLPGETDTHGVITYTTPDAINIVFTVTDHSPAASTITINGAGYTSGATYTLTGPGTLTVIVTTEEAGKITATRTFTIVVNP